MLLLPSIDLGVSLQKVNLPQCRFVPTFFPWKPPQVLDMGYMILFLFFKMDFNMHLSKHSWNKYFCSPNTHQDDNLQVSYVSYHSLWALNQGWTIVIPVGHYIKLPMSQCKVESSYVWYSNVHAQLTNRKHLQEADKMSTVTHSCWNTTNETEKVWVYQGAYCTVHHKPLSYKMFDYI